MRRLSAVLVLAAAAASPLAAQQTHAFVITIGRDTSAAERFTVSGTRIEGEGLFRQPRTTIRRYSVDIGPDGRPTRAEITQLRPGAAATDPPIQRYVATVTRDSVFSETRRDTAVLRRTAAPRGPLVTTVGGTATSFLPYEVVAEKLHRDHPADSMSVSVFAGGPTAQTWWAGPMGRDSIWIYDGNNRFHIHVDRDGRILHAVPVSGTQQFFVARVPSVDVNAMATAFASRDQAGTGLGVLSTRDTARATAAGATLWIDYGRPAKRGRQIFGTTIVPYGEVWRTGANAATQFRTDRALEMGGVVVPAGFYTLWTIPSPTGWKLLINTQTGQWGTAHDATKDIFALPMATTTLPQPVERFAITVVPSAQGGTLNFDWDTVRASIPFTVR